MAVDTENKRRSVAGLVPVADGTVSRVDSQQVAGFYCGIAAGTPAVIVQLFVGLVARSGLGVGLVARSDLSVGVS